jgi:hypothetical protein
MLAIISPSSFALVLLHRRAMSTAATLGGKLPRVAIVGTGVWPSALPTNCERCPFDDSNAWLRASHTGWGAYRLLRQLKNNRAEGKPNRCSSQVAVSVAVFGGA